MAQYINIYTVELTRGAAPVVPLRQIYYGDVKANRIGADVRQDGEPVTLTGTCSGTAILSDGSTVAITGAIDGSVAFVDLPAGCYSVEGQIQVFVKVTADGVTTTLLCAMGTVRITETGTVIDPGTVIPSVSALIAAIDAAVESIPQDYSALNTHVANQDKKFDVLDDEYLSYPTLEQGNIQNGANSTSSQDKRVRSAGYLSTALITGIHVNRSVKPYRTYVRYFTSKSSSGYVSAADVDFQAEYVPINNAYPYFRVVVVDMTGGTTQNAITPAAVTAAYTFFRPSTIDRAFDLAKDGEHQATVSWEQGNIQNGADSSTNATMRVRTIGYIETAKVSEFRVDRTTKPWRTYLFYYNSKSSSGYVSAADVNYKRDIVPIDSTYPYFRAVAVDMTGDSTQNVITPEQVAADYSAYELGEIVALEERMNGYEDAYPAYFDSQVASVTADVLAHKRLVGKDGFSFLFVTDLHWSQNAKNSPPLIQAMVNKTQTPCVILGGDYISQFADSKADAMANMQACIDAVLAKGIRDYVFPLFGNHDRNSNQTTSSVHMTKAETYAIINSWMSQRAVYADEYFDFYLDDEKSKTRIICIDTGAQSIDGSEVSTETMNWLSASINALASDWHVIVVAHWLWSPTTWNHPLVDGVPTGSYTSYAQTLFAALDTNNATSGKAKVEGIIAGHVHCDFEDATTGGIPIIFVDTDSKGAYGNYPATTGTISEQCFDAITFDYTAHKIYCDRIGRGVSRVYPSNS